MEECYVVVVCQYYFLLGVGFGLVVVVGGDLMVLVGQVLVDGGVDVVGVIGDQCDVRCYEQLF